MWPGAAAAEAAERQRETERGRGRRVRREGVGGARCSHSASAGPQLVFCRTVTQLCHTVYNKLMPRCVDCVECGWRRRQESARERRAERGREG